MNWLPSLSTVPYFLQMPDIHTASTTKYCRLGDLLQIKDSKWCKESKLDAWKALVFQDITSKIFPQQYFQDAKRYTMHVGRQTFMHPYEEHETESRFQRITNTTLSIINAIDDCPLANTTRGAHIIRYLAQDLMSQGIFAIDPEFPAQAVVAYDKKGVLLLPHQEGASKESSFSIFTHDATLCIEATQYWKVVNKFTPTEVRGHDGLKIRISIDLQGAKESTILQHFQEATCILQFHGFRRTLDEIKF